MMGWKIAGKFPLVPKSVVIFAPHTSFWDGLIGKLYFKEIGINHRFLSKKELFIFPLNKIMRFYGFIPVDPSSRYIFQVVDILNSYDQLHVVLSPEGTREKTSKWKRGFYYIAQRADVPVIIGYIDYSRKQIGVLDTLNKVYNVDETMLYISHLYKNMGGKNKNKFATEDILLTDKYN